MHHIPGLASFFKFHQTLTSRFVWPYSPEKDRLYWWRAYILSALLIAALLFGIFALVSAFILIVKENAWGLAIVDSLGLVLCITFLAVHRIRFEVRASVTLLTFYMVGIAVILSVGPLSGGAAWLFTFAVLAGILMGNLAAILAILMNAISLGLIGFLMSTGKIGAGFPFFNTPQTMIAAGTNFIVLNAITAVSVSALMKALVTSEKQYRMIAQNVADVIWTMDMDLNLTYISPSVLQLQGLTPEEAMKAPLVERLTPESHKKIMDLYQEKIRQLENGEERAWEPVIFETQEYHKDGSIIWTNIHARLLKGLDSNPEGILGITRDITERKRMEKERIQAQIAAGEHKKLALVGQIAGKMAHDFNNVLGIIMGHTELAMMDDLDSETRKTFELILKQTLRGKNITRNLIAFAKSPEPKQEAFRINEKIEFVLSLLKNDLEGISVVVETLEQAELLADPGMIEHTLVNLLQNSVHALSLTENPKITLRSFHKNNQVVFEIEDNGCGIPEQHLDDIYEPSFTLKGSRDVTGVYKKGIKGTGYGMANVKKYVALHSGSIRVESQNGAGTRVRISLPVAKKELPPDGKDAPGSDAPHSGKHILLVEDEPAISLVQERVLTKPPNCHHVDIAASGEDAVRLFENSHYDLVSLDYILSGKMNGTDVYKQIREKSNGIPVLFVSGNIEFLESIKALKQNDPYMDHLSKPCRNIDFVNSLNRLMKRSHA